MSGVSSYSSYREGIEIEIDAYNRGSVALAEKLGYHFSHEYEVYETEGY